MSEQERIKDVLRKNPKGLTIEEVSKKLSLNRATAAKYLNSLVMAGQADMRTLGPAKLFYLTQRLPLNNLLSLTSDLILVLDKDLFIQDVNEPFLEYFQVSREELKGEKFEYSAVARFFTREHQAALEKGLEGQEFSTELYFDIQDRRRYFLMKGTPLVFEEGGKGVGIILGDITSIKEYQHTLEEQVNERTLEVVKAKNFAENLIYTANTMIIGLDFLGNISIFNKAAEEITGYRSGEVVGKNWFETIVPKDHYPRVWDEFHQLSTSNPTNGFFPRDFENPIMTKSGDERLIRWSNNTVHEGGVVTGTISFGLDITDQKRAEIALRESEQRFRTLIEKAPVAISITRSGRIAYHNPALLRMFGYKEDENLVGKPIFNNFAKEAREEIADYVHRRSAGMPAPLDYETRGLRQDCSEFPIHVVVAVVHLAEGDASIAFLTDITDRKRAEEAIHKANKQILLLNSITRHDILNQLTKLNGYIGILKSLQEGDKSADLIRKEEQVIETVRRQIVFTRDYQNIGAQPPAWIDVKSTVANVISTLDLDGIRVLADTGDLQIFTDLLIEKVFFNLVENSILHGKKVTTIRLWYRQSNGGLVLVFEDDGTGIPPGEKDLIFERGHGKNTGYGLFLVREIL
ncbi:MAG: PAS domain S-box protein, partial [Methanoregula sp.]|nr:PAS domain S-box protein [Methanoregula sp.]